MVDLVGQYNKIQEGINEAVINCIRSSGFTNGLVIYITKKRSSIMDYFFKISSH